MKAYEELYKPNAFNAKALAALFNPSHPFQSPSKKKSNKSSWISGIAPHLRCFLYLHFPFYAVGVSLAHSISPRSLHGSTPQATGPSVQSGQQPRARSRPGACLSYRPPPTPVEKLSSCDVATSKLKLPATLQRPDRSGSSGHG